MSHLFVAGRIEPIEAVWYVNNAPVPGSVTIQFSRWVAGPTQQWWDGSGWITTLTTFPMTGFAPAVYYLTVPADWIADQVVMIATHSTEGEHVASIVIADPAALEAGSDTADYGGYTQ